MTTQTYTLFMLLKTTRRWLDLEPKVRFAFIKENVKPIRPSACVFSTRNPTPLKENLIVTRDDKGQLEFAFVDRRQTKVYEYAVLVTDISEGTPQ